MSLLVLVGWGVGERNLIVAVDVKSGMVFVKVNDGVGVTVDIPMSEGGWSVLVELQAHDQGKIVVVEAGILRLESYVSPDIPHDSSVSNVNIAEVSAWGSASNKVRFEAIKIKCFLTRQFEVYTSWIGLAEELVEGANVVLSGLVVQVVTQHNLSVGFYGAKREGVAFLFRGIGMVSKGPVVFVVLEAEAVAKAVVAHRRSRSHEEKNEKAQMSMAPHRRV